MPRKVFQGLPGVLRGKSRFLSIGCALAVFCALAPPARAAWQEVEGRWKGASLGLIGTGAHSGIYSGSLNFDLKKTVTEGAFRGHIRALVRPDAGAVGAAEKQREYRAELQLEKLHGERYIVRLQDNWSKRPHIAVAAWREGSIRFVFRDKKQQPEAELVLRRGAAWGKAGIDAGADLQFSFSFSPREKSAIPLRLEAALANLDRPRSGPDARDNSASRENLLASRQARYRHIIQRAAEQHDIDAALIKAVILAESAFNPRAVSSKQAAGLMQLTQPTAKMLGVQDVFDPADNILGGARYLKRLMDRFQTLDLALAAYNAGPGAVQRVGGVPPYPETLRYVQTVKRYYQFFRSSAPQVL